MKSLRHNLILFVLLSMTLVGASCQRLSDRSNSDSDERSDPQVRQVALLTFGNPSNAGTDPDNYLLIHRSHTLSYNNARGTLNWIAWRTTSADLGEKRERSRFEEDRTLPNGFRRVQYYDYSGSGFDRGHMVPAADRFADESLMEETFLMTNIVPQTGDLNQFPWNKLEMYARGISRTGSELYTIAGVYGEKGRLRGKVTIPTNCWKVIVVLPRGQTTISKTTRIIAVDMPNIDGIESESWQIYQTTVREIELKTGLDLFSTIPRDVQDTVETKRMMASP
ncbi:MAG: DNA/RNA non-specific endonuclease [Pyrinomonadaceae bacterium]